MNVTEFERQRRVVDQSLSAHTTFAEWMRRRRRLLIMSIIILSVAATALAFADEHSHIDFVFYAALPIWAGVLSTLVFVLALADLVFGWDKVAAQHEDAARRLDALAVLFRSARVENGTIDTGAVNLESEYWSTMNSIARIPNRYFVKLKAQHLRKVELSKAVSAAPYTSILVLKGKLLRRDTKRLCEDGANASSEPCDETFLPDELDG